ncbi:hypothetical protein L1D24_05290 [Vibrio brasiliensis]|uniref:hypothetical protein n=1 Tax=Vibrio brasiliensis TaxID=170652 RepID=UPI001EFE9D4D|nr:hypothetical protein [Vibrio brasiliensis]MCG9647983.1 hypothetical protein [Vibrio brasiliensis]
MSFESEISSIKVCVVAGAELSKSNDRSMTEYVLIGSLVSVVITTLVGTLMSLGLGNDIK